MSLVQLVLVLALAAILLPLGIRGLVWRQVRERRLHRPRIRLVPIDALPNELDPVFEAAERTLLPLGFETLGARWVGSIDRYEDARPERAYRHAESRTLAFAGPPLPGMGERPYRVTFVSRLRDGRVVVTFDGLTHLTPGVPPDWECHDHDVNDLGKQWALHLHSLEPHGEPTRTTDVALETWNEEETRSFRRALEAWERARLIRRVRVRQSNPPGETPVEPTWRFRWRPAWDLGGRFLSGQRRVLAAEAEHAKSRAHQQLWRDNIGPVTDALEPELDDARAVSMAWGYEYDQRAERARLAERSTRSKWWLGLLGAVACLGLFGWWLGWQLAWILVAVLLIHELGHLAAMEAFGYRDRRILFIPFFGAATLGEKEDASPEQRTLVYMLGPAPGILLGLAALYGFLDGGSLWWLAGATAALLVNYLNLLPISPLDGGRIVETLLLGRFPRAQVAFIGLGALVFAAGAWVLKDPILAGIALALVISLRTAWIAAGALVRARRTVESDAPDAEKIRSVFDLLQRAPYRGTPAAQRVRLAGIVIPRLGHEPASLRTAVAGGLVYLTMLIGVPLAVTGSVYAFAPTVWESVVGSATVAVQPGPIEPSLEPVVDHPIPSVPIKSKDDANDAGPTAPKTSESGEAKGQISSRSISEASLVGR
ncbi:MAG: site-2 protease family protein [Gemmatimonadetes bacterium]|nr:site-2 protease family protein [Gemmatimonadota bacterium]